MTEQEKRDLIRTLCESQEPGCTKCPFYKIHRQKRWCYHSTIAALPADQLDDIIRVFYMTHNNA